MGILVSLLSADCAETEARLSDHLEGTVSRWRRSRLVRHPIRSEGCQAVLSSLTVAVERLRALGRHSLPPSAATAEVVAERIRRDTRAGGRR